MIEAGFKETFVWWTDSSPVAVDDTGEDATESDEGIRYYDPIVDGQKLKGVRSWNAFSVPSP